MSDARRRKIESEIQRVLAEVIARGVKDPRVGNVTITSVSLAADMGAAKVFFTPFASLNPAEEVRTGLTCAGGFLRGEVGRRLQLRHAPRLEFVIDLTPQRAAHLTDLIDRAVKGERPRGDLAATSEAAEETAPEKAARGQRRGADAGEPAAEEDRGRKP